MNSNKNCTSFFCKNTMKKTCLIVDKKSNMERNRINLLSIRRMKTDLATPEAAMCTSWSKPKEEHTYYNTSAATLPFNTPEVFTYDYAAGKKLNIINIS